MVRVGGEDFVGVEDGAGEHAGEGAVTFGIRTQEGEQVVEREGGAQQQGTMSGVGNQGECHDGEVAPAVRGPGLSVSWRVARW